MHSKKKAETKYKKLAVVIIIAIVVILLLILNKNTNLFSSIVGLNNLTNAVDYDTTVGENAIVSSATITETLTGSYPFDEDSDTDSTNADESVSWTAGNDISADDNIVRSFDEITWTIDLNLALKENPLATSYSGGVIKIEATVPSDFATLVKWDLDNMSWIENATLSDDGTNLVGYYSMSTSDINVPGKCDLILSLQLYGIANGKELIPTFKTSLYGNDENESYEFSADTIYVSAKPSYNIKLNQNGQLAKKVTVDYGEGDKRGRMYAFSATLQLYNEDQAKGLKGIEYPQGDITYDIDLALTQDGTDITEKCPPILWNYRISNNDGSSAVGKIEDRVIYWGNSYHVYDYHAALGVRKDNYRFSTVYDSGDISMNINGSHISTSVYDYDFDGIFPNQYYYWGNTASTPDYTDNIGCFSVGYFQVFVPDYDEILEKESASYKLIVSDSNLNVTSSSGIQTTEQVISSDDQSTVSHIITNSASYGQTVSLSNDSSSSIDYALPGDYVRISSKCSMGVNNDDDAYSLTKFVKIDGDGIEPAYFTSVNSHTGTNKYQMSGYGNGEILFDVYYVTKEDGSNWNDIDEMNTTDIDDPNLEVYNNIEDIPENKICIGVYLESTADEDACFTAVSGDNNTIILRFRIKETAQVGETYPWVVRTKFWLDYVDRELYNVNTNNFDKWPEAIYDKGVTTYIKAEYDDDGNLLSGTDTPDNNGASVLVIGSNISISEKAIDENGNEKTNYDLGKNEETVIYQISPTLPVNGVTTIEGVTLKITATLPQGLTYVTGSSNYENLEVIQNSDGTTTLIWYLYNLTVGETIDPITFEARIDVDTANETHYTVDVEIKEAINEGENYKVGNIVSTDRSASTSIVITNMASYSLFKETITPIIEKDGEMHFKISALNKTENNIDNFCLLDILPYNDDSRGSSFSGSYIVEKIVINQTDSNTGEEIEGDIKLYVSNNIDARNVTVKDSDLENNSIWDEPISADEINDELTAFLLMGNLNAKEKLEIDIYMQTIENNPGDVYYNIATADVGAEMNEMETSVITVQVVTRKIDGYVWLDSNGDGLISDGEEYLSNVTVTLLNSDGEEALDVNGNVIAPTVTDEKGYYYFEYMEKGDYIVKFQSAEEIIDKNYEFTEKEASINKPLTSKVNEDGLTDIITSLNNTDSPNLVEEYVNAGIREINIKYITVNKEWVDTEDQKDKRPESINFNIYKTDESGNKTGDVVSSYKLITSSGTSHTFEVEKYDSNGVDINYVVEETEVNEGDLYFYESEGGVVTEETNETTGDIEYTATITNIFTVPQVEETITVTKIWDDDEDEAQKRPSSIKINLNYTENGEVKQESNTLDIANNKSECYFTVNKYDENGNEINYIVSEEEVNENDLKFYSATIGEMTKITDTDYSVQITNKFEVEQEYIEVTATKNWVYENDTQAKRIPESVSLALVNGETTVETLEAQDSNSWTVTFGESQNVAKYNELGDEIEYTVKEVDDLEFWVSSGEANVQDDDGSYRAEITNTFVVPSDTQTIQVTKVWEDNGLNRPEIDLSLTGESETYIKPATSANVDSTNSNQWLVDFEVPKYNSNGEDAEYTLSEENISNYITSIDGYTVTNTAIFVDNSIVKTSNTTQITSVNEAIDYTIIYNVDVGSRYTGNVIVTIVDTLPYEINESESSLSGGTYNAEDRTITWTGSYNTETKVITWSDGTTENLNSLYVTKEISIVYSNLPVATGTVIENKVQGIALTESGAYIDGSASFEITTNFSIDVNVNKVWVGDSDADRPEEITVKLLATVDGNDYELTGVDTELILNTGNNWKGTFTYLPKYDSSYNLIEYTVYEVESEDLNNYYNSIESTQGEGILNFVVTNSKYGSVILTKVDNSDNTKLLEGAEFKIEKLDDNGDVDESFDVIYKTTDGDGKLTFENLRYGKYLITETKAPDDYNLATSSITVEINGDDPDIEVTAYNKHKYDILETGGNGMTILITISIAILIIGFKVSKPKKVARISLADKRYKEYKKEHKINRNS